MGIQIKKTVIGIGIMLVLTSFAGMTMTVNAQQPPVANSGGPYEGYECYPISLDASGSYDPDGDPLTYSWYISGVWYDNANNPYYEWTWLDDYSGEIILEVSDGESTVQESTQVTILNTPPQILDVDGPTEVSLDTEFFLIVNFFDGLPDPRGWIASLDEYTASFDWGDGSSTVLPLGVIPQGSEGFPFSASHAYEATGEFEIMIVITDDDGGQASWPWDIVVDGTLKLVDAGPDGVIDEGSEFISDGFLADDSGTYTAQVDYGDGSGPQDLLLNPGNTFDLQHQYYDNGVFTILVTAYNEGEEWGSDSVIVTVNNIAPTAMLNNDGPTGEGSMVLVSFSDQNDPGVFDTFTYSFDWNNDGTYDIVDQTSDSASYVWADNGVYLVKGMIKDNDGGSTEYTTDVIVENVPPTALLSNNGPKDEGSPVMTSFTNQYDPGTSDTFFYSFDWNGDGIYEISDQPGASASYTWYDNGVYLVNGKITDSDGGFNEYTTTVTVNNVPPTITSFSGPPTDPVPLSTVISLSGLFTDPGILDSHIALIEWGDGQTTSVNLAAEVYQVSGSHIYQSAGVYMVNLTVTDDDGGFDSASLEYYVVVYNPNGGFVTGGGWVIAQPGSYPVNPSLSGRANFGFVAKYKKGLSVPEGNTEFQFQAGSLNFHSHTYEWLLIVGPVAIYKGSGTINGAGNYAFMVTAIDGKIAGGGGVDTFRIKIWDSTNDDLIVFDNGNTALSGGQITIHK
jgi:PKD repeat protein